MKFRYMSMLGLFFVLMWNLYAETSSVEGSDQTVREKLSALEASSGGRLGAVMLEAGGDTVAVYRGAERFPMCSTFKMMLVAAILKQSTVEPDLMERHITFTKDDLVSWSPVTEKHVADGMRVTDLCAAAITQSDNTAANLMLKLLNGPQGLTSFARSIGDRSFRLDRWETSLNEALPEDERDTTTPEAMARSLRAIAFDDVLPAPQRNTLLGWLKGNTTGEASIRAGIPADWIAGDKTGSGGFGTTNDIAVLWPVEGQPLILAVYFTQKAQDAPSRKDVIAAATRLIVAYWQTRNP